MAVVRGDEVVLLLGLGTRDADKKLPVTVDSPFYIASSTKSFTAMAVAILADEGKIDLDAPVKRYLPRFTLANEAVAEKMTVRDLLAHRLGIDSGPISTNEAYTGLITEDRYYRLLKRVTPKSEFRYSNLNFTLAGRVIEAASGQSWKQFIAQRILRPPECGTVTAWLRSSTPIRSPRSQWSKWTDSSGRRQRARPTRRCTPREEWAVARPTWRGGSVSISMAARLMESECSPNA